MDNEELEALRCTAPKVVIEPDPVIEAYKAGVDRTLFRENWKLSVDERFRKLMALQRFAAELQKAGRAVRQEENKVA